MTHNPRLAPSEEVDWDDETRQMLDGLGRLNIFTTLAHHPKLMKRWMVFGSHVLNKASIPERERELVILRTGYRCACVYEFGQHTVIGRRCGITDDEIARIASPAIEGWSEDVSVLLQAADELVADKVPSDATWSALSSLWTTEEVLDFIFAIGQYTLVCMALNSLRVVPDEGTPGWPA